LRRCIVRAHLHIMPESPKILFVVEGSTDAKLVNRIRELFNCSAAIYTINANIYALYLKVKDDPYADTLQVLKEMRNSETDKRILDLSRLRSIL